MTTDVLPVLRDMRANIVRGQTHSKKISCTESMTHVERSHN